MHRNVHGVTFCRTYTKAEIRTYTKAEIRSTNFIPNNINLSAIKLKNDKKFDIQFQIIPLMLK